MDRDPSKKGVRKIPKQFLDWIENTYNKDTALWYKTNAGRSKAWASKDRVNLSEEVGKVGAYHEGHFQGAKDFDLKTGMGGGPTTGRTMRSEIGVLNVAHAEKPRIPKAEMKRLGIPQYWLDDFYEAILESENLKVIGNLDRQAALDIDAGMPIEQAAAQSRFRDDLRNQGMIISGSRPVYRKTPAPLPENITQQAVPPEFDVSEIKTTGEVKVKPRTSRIPKVPQNPVEFVSGIKVKGGNLVFGTVSQKPVPEPVVQKPATRVVEPKPNKPTKPAPKPTVTAKPAPKPTVTAKPKPAVPLKIKGGAVPEPTPTAKSRAGSSLQRITNSVNDVIRITPGQGLPGFEGV